MKAVVLAGGVRSGLEVPGSGLPRALWPFPKDPLITHVLAFLKRSGCDSIAICANGKTRLIAAELSGENSPWLDLHYSEDPLPRGPAGCLRDLADWLGNDPIIAIQATGSYDFDLAAMIDEHRRTGAAVTVGARRCPDDVDLLEPAGVYIVNPSTLHLVHPTAYQDFKEQFLPRLISVGLPVRCHCLKGTATLIHSPGHYLSALREAIMRSSEQLPAGYRLLADHIVVHDSASLHPSARLTGPLWIEPGASVGERAVLAGPIVLGRAARVESDTIVHRTVIMHDAVVAAGTELYGSILAPHAVRSPGTKSNPVQPRSSLGGRQESRPWSTTGSRSAIGRLLGMFDASHP